MQLRRVNRWQKDMAKKFYWQGGCRQLAAGIHISNVRNAFFLQAAISCHPASTAIEIKRCRSIHHARPGEARRRMAEASRHASDGPFPAQSQFLAISCSLISSGTAGQCGHGGDSRVKTSDLALADDSTWDYGSGLG
jgi:hypothetical protein